MNDYRYYVKAPFESWQEIFPINAMGALTYEKRSDDGLVFEKKLTGKLKFSNNSKEGITDFNYFKDKEINSKCEELDFRIDKKCGSTYAIFWEGLFAPVEGTFYNDRCIYEIEPRMKESLQSDIKVNIVDVPNSHVVYAGTLANQRIYTNGRLFKDVILYVAQQSNSKITGLISDFFQINPEHLSNEAIPGIFNDYNQMVLMPISQIQEPLPSGDATKEFVSFDELMSDINSLFDVFWFIDSNYKLRIEHRTYFEGVVSIDLTAPEYAKWIAGQNTISYDLNEFPRYETFKIVGSMSYARLSYSGCGLINKNENEVSRDTTVIYTDFFNLRYLSGGGAERNGLFLFACRQSLGQYRMIEVGMQNTMLQPATLVLKFHRHGRPWVESVFECYYPEDTGSPINVNQGDFLAYSIKPIKSQVPIKIPFCCTDNFDPKNQVKTPLGIGYVDKASIENNMLKLNLKYKTVDDNADIIPKNLPGLRLWLKGDAGVIIDPLTTLVSEWQDQSGNNLHAVQTVGGLQPQYDSANKIIIPGLGFLQTPAFQLFPSKRGTIFLLFSKLSGSSPGDDSLLSTNDGTSANFFDLSIDWVSGPTDDTNHLYSYSLGMDYPSFLTGANISGLINIIRDSDTSQTIWENGIKPSQAVFNPMTIPNTQIDTKPLIIGKNATLGTACYYAIKEIIIYDRELDNIERQKIELYLSKKWLINLYTGF